MVDYQTVEIMGIELIEQIRSSVKYLFNAVLVTANQQGESHKRCAKNGVGFLKNRVKPAAMRAILKRFGSSVGCFGLRIGGFLPGRVNFQSFDGNDRLCAAADFKFSEDGGHMGFDGGF